MKMHTCFPLLTVCCLSLICCRTESKKSFLQGQVQLQQLKQLLQNGADSSFRDKNGEDLLHLAISSQDRRNIVLIDSLYPGLRDEADSGNYHPIHTAAANCSLG